MRGSRLRWQLFGAISVVVLICVALTIGLGLVLTQREVKKSALRDLAHQVDLIVGNQGVSSVKALRPKIQETLNKSPQHEIFLYKRRDLPLWAQQRNVLHNRQPGLREQPLHRVLVHARCRAQHARAHISNAR